MVPARGAAPRSRPYEGRILLLDEAGVKIYMELAAGLAPATPCLQNRSSTVELRQRVILPSYDPAPAWALWPGLFYWSRRWVLPPHLQFTELAFRAAKLRRPFSLRASSPGGRGQPLLRRSTASTQEASQKSSSRENCPQGRYFYDASRLPEHASGARPSSAPCRE